jgi:hypothetical protein
MRLRIGSGKPYMTDKIRILTFAGIVENPAATILTPQKTIPLIICILSRVGTFKYDQVLRKCITVLWLCESEDTKNHWHRQQLLNDLAVCNGVTFVGWNQVSITKRKYFCVKSKVSKYFLYGYDCTHIALNSGTSFISVILFPPLIILILNLFWLFVMFIEESENVNFDATSRYCNIKNRVFKFQFRV